MRGTWPFAGRSGQVARLRKVLARPAPESLVVAGAAGVGKSRLVSEALAGLDKRRIAVLSAMATSATRPLPYGAFAHLLAATPDVAGEPRVGPDLVAQRLLTRAEGRRVVLAVDDAHLLDTHSATLIHRLVRARVAGAVITLRSEEMVPDPVMSLWTEGLADRIELGPLTGAEIDAVLEGALEGPVDPATSRRLFRLSEGNVLLLRELVLAADESGSLVCTRGVWALAGQLPVHPRLRELVDSRLGHLEPNELDVLELVALAEPVGLQVVCGLAGEDAVEAAEAKHLIRVETDQRRQQLRLGHPLYGEVIRARCPIMRMRRQRRRLADALEATGARRRDDILRIATWRLDSGVHAEVELLTTATRLAWNVHDVDLAARLGQAAIQAGAGASTTVAFGKALLYADRPAEAEKVLAAAQRRATTDADRVELASALAITKCLGDGRRAEADRILDDAERQLSKSATTQQVWATRAFLHYYAAEFDAALEHAERVLNSVPADSGIAADTASIKALVLAHQGRVEEAVDLADTLLGTADRWRSSAAVAELRLHQARGLALIASGHPEAARRVTDRVYATVADTSWRMGAGVAEMYAAFELRLQGNIEQAVRWAMRAAERCPIGQTVFGATFSGEWAHCAALGGDLDTAVRVLDQAQHHRNDAARTMEFFIDMARPVVAGGQGRHEEAVELALAGAEQARRHSVFAFEMLALHQAVGFGGAPLVADRLQQLAEELDGDLAPVCATHARAAATGDPIGLAAASEAFEELGLTLFAAEAATQASLSYRAAGRGDRARAANARAWALAARCPGARIPALATISSPGLTTREREVAGLAVEGLTSRQIAERLTTSIRTVDNHLRSVYAKLSISSRAELATGLALPRDPGTRTDSR